MFFVVQALQASAATSAVEGPEGGVEVYYWHHRESTKKLPSLVSPVVKSLLFEKMFVICASQLT